MLKQIMTSAFAMTLIATAAPAMAAAPITGKWYTEGKRAIVTVSKCGNVICGKITKFIEAPKDGITTDVNNPDGELRKRKLLGLPVLSNFNEDGKQWRGTIYDPEAGKTYRSVVYQTKSGNLTVKGCIGPFCQSQTWVPAG